MFDYGDPGLFEFLLSVIVLIIIVMIWVMK